MSNPVETLAFDEIRLPDITPLTDPYAGLGVTFTNIYYNPAPGFTPPSFGIKNFNLPDIGNFINPAPPLNPIAISFNVAETGAAFALITDGPATATFTAMRNGMAVETDTLPTLIASGANVYVYSGDVFDQVRITNTSGDGSILLDNLQLTAVPEPSPLLLAMAVASAGGLGC